MTMTLMQQLVSIFTQEETEFALRTHRGEERTYSVTGSDVLHELMQEDTDDFHKFWKKLYPDENVTIDLLDSYGGEDQGSDFWAVYRFSNGIDTVLLKFDGYYQSHYGTEFNEWFEVKPVEVTRIEYERA